MLRLGGSVAAFAVAVESFSRLWQGVRSALEGQRLYGPVEALGWMAAFWVSLGYLAFVIYAADRTAGRTRRPMPLFDRWLDRRADRPQGGAGSA
ncbi:MAG: hypothetical protein QN183_08855 [Armatimonadota bacterium]|nr:hypothetical protein [Armatimonadota bacterium]MDR7533340.1 hypothetical protein [Armatimonadota bacterium]MDR7536460.1 hypothetical protein [Armatimonadota bacterium]